MSLITQYAYTYCIWIKIDVLVICDRCWLYVQLTISAIIVHRNVIAESVIFQDVNGYLVNPWRTCAVRVTILDLTSHAITFPTRNTNSFSVT